MSVSIKIKTSETIDVNVLFTVLKTFYEDIIIDDTEPFLFYRNGISTRYIEFDKTDENDAYYVRKVILFSKEDCDLYLRTIALIQAMSNGIVLNEDDEEIDVESAGIQSWIFDSIYSEYNSLKILIEADKETELCLFGPIRSFYFGKRILDKLKTHSKHQKDQYDYLIELFRKSQYGLPENADYPNIMQISKEHSETHEPIKLLLLSNSNEILVGATVDYYIINTNAGEDEELLVIKRNDIHKIAPQKWWLFDDKQYVAPIVSTNEWNKFIEDAQPYRISLDDL